MTPFKKHSLTLILASSFAALAACGGSSSGTTNATDGETGRFSLAVTDAPVDMANHVVVEFSGVSIKPAVGEVIEFTFEEARSIDLLALQGSASESLLTDEEVPTGDYEWIRLHVNAEADGVLDSYIELQTGNQLELRIPSGSQTGLKLVNGFTVTASGAVDFTVDFDLRKSVVLPPASAIGAAIFKPTLRLVDNTMAGAIAGAIDAELITQHCEDPANETGAVYVYTGTDAALSDVRGEESDPIITALVHEAGGEYEFEAGFLDVGDYTLAYTCDAINDDPEEADDELIFIGETNASVEANVTTEVNFTLESVESEQ